MEQDIDSKYSEQSKNASESPVSTGESRITKPPKRIDSNLIAAFASLVAAFAAVALGFIAWWQDCQSEKALKVNLAESRPILMLDIAGEKLPSDLSRVDFIVKNSGPIPARLIHKATQPWIDGKTRNPTDHIDVDIVF